MSEIVITPVMTREEAQAHVDAIKNAVRDMGLRLLEMKAREGWRALGYANWTAFLTGEFAYSRKHLYELMEAAPVLEKMLPTGNKISIKAAAALAAFDEELHPVIIGTAQARYGTLTESNVNRVGSVVQQMTYTGHVDIGNGRNTPIEAALALEDEEAAKRRLEYIHQNSKVKLGDTLFDEAGKGSDVWDKLRGLWRELLKRNIRITIREVIE